MQRKSAQISIFLSMIFICICTLMMGLIEIARTAGARWYLQTAMNSSIDSLFSQYHPDLWNKYYIFGLEETENQIMKQTFSYYLNAYLKTENWYPMELIRTEITQKVFLTDDAAIHFQQQILDYMDFFIFDQQAILPEQAELLYKDLNEQMWVSKMAQGYDQCTFQILRMEATIAEIAQQLNQQKDLLEKSREQTGQQFIITVETLKAENEGIPWLVEEYIRYEDGLLSRLEEVKCNLELQQTAAEEEHDQILNRQLNDYQQYLFLSEERRGELEILKETQRSNQQILEVVLEIAGTIMDSEEADASWEPVWNELNHYQINQLIFSNTKGEKQSLDWLEAVWDLMEFKLIDLVIPDGVQLSKQRIPLEQCPSLLSAGEVETDGGDPLIKMLTNEYSSQVFTNFTSDRTEAVQCQMEYLIGGGDLEENNLESAARGILALREGTNFLYLLSDSSKRESAKGLASVIVGIAGTEVLVSVLTTFILGIWALAEAAVDLHQLLGGGKVPLIKTQVNWNLNLDQVLELGKNQEISSGAQSQEGTDYVSYLKIILMIQPSERKYFRMMDIMQLNIRYTEPGFLIADSLYSVEINSTVCGKHLFSSLPIVENSSVQIEPRYEMHQKTWRSY